MNDTDIINFEQSSAATITEVRAGFFELDIKLDALKIAEKESAKIINRIREGEAATPNYNFDGTGYLAQLRAMDRYFCISKGCAEMTANDFEYCDRCLLA